MNQDRFRMTRKNHSRRSFLKKAGISAAGIALLPVAARSATPEEALTFRDRGQKKYSANDRIRVALIGTGGMGIGDAQTALQVSGIELVAACDLYSGRRLRAKELFGDHIQTTADYREILNRSDVDAIINATTDHLCFTLMLNLLSKYNCLILNLYIFLLFKSYFFPYLFF